MPANETGSAETRTSPPSMLDLIRLSPRRLFPPGGVELYRQIALLTGMTADHEVLDVSCGKGVPLEYFVREFGVHGSGVDPEPRLIDQAEARARALGIADRLQFQTGRPDALPYRDEIFDVAVGEIGLASRCDPADAVRELVRVTKPGGFIVLVQLVWKAPVDADRRGVLAAHLGARPRMVVEWKRFLREAEVEDLHTEDWSDARTAFRTGVAKPFPDFAELFSVGEKVGIMRRAWRRWGWRGVWNTMARERAVHRLLTRERILGLDLIRGRKVAVTVDPMQEAQGDGRDRAPQERARLRPMPDDSGEDSAGVMETSGLPLFGEGGERREE
jgi:SAM-dependent methyltransferase